MVCARTPGQACAGTLMPQPLNMTLLTSTIAQPYQLGYLTRWLTAFHASYCALHQCANASSDTVLLFERLRQDGLAWSTVGIDFARVQHVRFPNAAEQALNDPEVRKARSVLNKTHSTLRDAEWTQILWESDQPWRRPQCALSGVESGALHSLLQDGFVKVNDWGLNITALREQAEDILKRSGAWGRAHSYLTTRARVPAVEQLLHNTTLANIIQEYLGGPARFDGYATFRLFPNATVNNYISGHWHHDRCGRRLRLFVFVNDVDARTMPITQAARGSQNTLYFKHVDDIAFTRFSDGYVHSKHAVESLDGPAGGGFILDTNGIHRGRLGGTLPRTTVMLEFHRHGKIPRLAELRQIVEFLPCPSIKLGKNWTAGLPGFHLYPMEVAKPFTIQRKPIIRYRSKLRLQTAHNRAVTAKHSSTWRERSRALSLKQRALRKKK